MSNSKKQEILKEIGFKNVGILNNDDKIIMFADKDTNKEYYIYLLGALKKGVGEGVAYKLKEVYQEANWKSAKTIKTGFVLNF